MGAAEDILTGIRNRQKERDDLTEEERTDAKKRTTARLDRIKSVLSDPDGLDGHNFDQAMEVLDDEEEQ